MKRQILIISMMLSIASLTYADDHRLDFSYKHTAVKGSISMLHGEGGNIGILQSDEDLLIVDDGFEKNSTQLDEALAELGKPMYLLNTHWHGDHTGGNASLGKNITILAHENVRTRLIKGSSTGYVVEPAPLVALPDVTYQQGITLHFGGQTVSAMHFPNGHTDGDSVIFFEPAHVVHMGDLLFAGSFPYIDPSSGGSVAGYTANVAAIIGKLDETSVVIPGHGELTNLTGVKEFYAMILETSENVRTMKSRGKTLEQAQEIGVGEKWNGWGNGFIDESRWISILWEGLD